MASDAINDAIGHLRPPFSMKTPSCDARLMPPGSRGPGVLGRVVRKKRLSFLNRFLVGAEGVEPPTMASHRLSFYPQSLRDSPEGHADGI